jgi:alpha-N-arabinofuranosidase
MTGIMEFAGIWKRRSQVFATPSYYAFRMYANAEADRRVQANANSGSYSISQGVDRLPAIPSVPYLDVVATLSQDGRRLTLFCVNRSLDTDIPAAIRIQHFDSKPVAAVQSLSSRTIRDENDEVSPSNVAPVNSAETMQSAGWSHVFPRASVMVISMDRK